MKLCIFAWSIATTGIWKSYPRVTVTVGRGPSRCAVRHLAQDCWRFAEAVGASLFLPLAVSVLQLQPEPFKLCSHEGRDSLQPLPVVRGQAYPHQTEQPLHLPSPCQPVLHRPGQRPGHADPSIRENTTYWLSAIPMAAMSSLSAADTTSGSARSMSSIVTSI